MADAKEVGLFVTVCSVVHGTTLFNEIYTNWHGSEDEALGFSVKDALSKHPNGRLLAAKAEDVTAIISQRPTHTRKESDHD